MCQSIPVIRPCFQTSIWIELVIFTCQFKSVKEKGLVLQLQLGAQVCHLDREERPDDKALIFSPSLKHRVLLKSTYWDTCNSSAEHVQKHNSWLYWVNHWSLYNPKAIWDLWTRSSSALVHLAHSWQREDNPVQSVLLHNWQQLNS